MLVSEEVSRTWRCDGLDCPTADQVAIDNPFFKVIASIAPLPSAPSAEVDLCDFCIQTITAPIIVQYVADAALFP